MAEYRNRYAELSSLGLGLVALSVDEPMRSRAFSQQLDLPFPLLCDPDRKVVRAYELLNTKEKGGIAFPATFVLDRERTVRFRSLDRTASRVNLDALFEFLHRGLDSEPPAKPARTRLVPRFGDFLKVTRNALRYGTRSPTS